MERRRFTREFKLEAVRLIKERGVSYAQASHDLGVHQSQLRSWVKALAADPQHAFPGQGQMKPEQLEIAQLKREVIKLKAERDILKKAKRTSAENHSGMVTVHPNAAAIDVGATMHMAAVGADCTSDPVRSFGTFTGDLHRLADWFAECGVKTVVMESTGVYWIPIFELLDERGVEVFLVNARDAKHVPGRKTDVSDAQWLQRLHSHGLLRASFRPKGEIAELRAYIRQRERLLDYAASHIQHMQKAPTEMNLQLHHGVADITGATGLRIIRAILAGERDPEALAGLRHYSCQSSAETIAKALTGSYRAEHLFALEQALALYDAYHEKASACDARIETVLKELSIHRGQGHGPAPRASRRQNRTDQANALAFDVREALFALLGKDITTIDGLGPYLSLKLIAECGDDLSSWPSAKHFTSWLGLAPSNKVSGGKMLSSRTRRSGGRAAALLRLAAVTVGRTDTALGAFYRRLSSRIGKAKAVTATARNQAQGGGIGRRPLSIRNAR